MTLGVLPQAYDVQRDLVGFTHDGVEVAEVEWENEPGGSTSEPTPVVAPRIAGRMREEFDFWIIAQGMLPRGIVAPRVPYAVYAADFIARYVPLLYGDGGAANAVWADVVRQFRIMRNARCVFATTPQTATDAIAYAGVRRERILSMPLFLGTVGERPQPLAARGQQPFVLWVSNPTPHKNHLTALDALTIYYGELGGELDVQLCGSGTELLDPRRIREGGVAPYWVDVAMRLASRPVLRDRVRILGEVDDSGYAELLRGAAFLWHPVIYDNGTFAALDAGHNGKVIVSADYPQMRHLAGYFGLTTILFDPRDSRAAAQALKTAEKNSCNGSLTGTLRIPADHDDITVAAFVELIDRTVPR